MNTALETDVNFYSSLHDYAFAEPYAVLRNSEVASLLQRFDRWVSTIATHPSLVDMLGDSTITCIKRVTALRVAVRESMQAGLFPNVIFSPNEYRAAMNFLAETRGHREVSNHRMVSTRI
jgi:hypothetical protein